MYSNAFVVVFGMGVVFVGLICIIALTALMGRVMGERKHAPAQPAAVPAAAPSAPAAPAQDAGILVAVITSALCESIGTSAADIKIKSITKI